jgi:predicted O-methyltransferase YrrM
MNWREYCKSPAYKALPPGQLYKNDERCLLETARGRVAEVGCLMGRSAAIMSVHADTVTTIDIFDNYDLIQDDAQRAHYKELTSMFPHTHTSVSQSLSAYKNITVMEGTSDLLLSLGELDFIFLDGDHSYEGVKRDYLNAMKVLSPTGTIAFHDSNVQEPGMGVYLLMAELKKERDLVVTPYWDGGVVTLLRRRQ